MTAVRHNEALGRYEFDTPNGLAIAVYHRQGDRLVFTHTEVPSADEFHPLCVAGNSALSYTHLATSLYVAHLEPFFVKSLRRVMDQIRDDGLREDVDRFSRQEAQHYQR